MTYWIIFALISIVSWLILFPLVIYYAIQLWSYKHIDTIAKRQPLLVVWFAICGTALSLLSRTYFAVSTLLELEQIETGIFGNRMVTDIASSISYFYVALFDQILWVSWFNWVKSSQLLKRKWKEHLHLVDVLNNNENLTKLPWTLQYGKLLTDKKLLCLFAFLFWICCASILIALPNQTLIQSVISLILALIVILPAIILRFKSNGLFDSLGMKKQFYSVCTMFLATFILLAINLIVVPRDTQSRKYKTCATYAILTWGLSLICLRMVYVEQLQQYINTKMPERIDVNIAPSVDDIKMVNFTDVWSNKQLFELFANHCTKQYSIETVLFLLEFEQCRQLIINCHDLLIEDIDERKCFMECLSKSKALFEDMYVISSDILKLKDISLTLNDTITLLKYLFDHYIDEDSVDAINISWQMRAQIISIFNKYELLQKTNSQITKTRKHSFRITSISSPSGTDNVSNTTANMISDIIIAFDSISAELFLLLQKDPWYRFRQTDVYSQFTKEMQI